MRIRIPALIASCAIALPVAAEDPLWEWVTPWPQGRDLYAAAAGGGVTVAVGASGTVVTSTDGAEWTIARTGAAYGLSDVVWGNGLFVAVGSYAGWEFNPVLGVILTSADGVDWIERYRTESRTVDAVVWTGSRFVAVGVADKVLLSSDGISWSEKETGSEAWAMMDLAWNGSMLVAIGSDNVPWFGHHSYFTSDSGEEWALYPLNRDYAPESIAASDGRFVAVGSEHDALVSDDGLTWTVAPYESSRQLRLIVDGGHRFLAIGNDVVGTSTDGYVWSIEDEPMESRVWGLAWLGNGFLAVGEDGLMMSSMDGSEWTQISTNIFGPRGSQEINELATDGSTIVGVGAGMITGRYGGEWTWRPGPGERGAESIIWTGSAFWAAGSDGILVSVDGSDWEQMLLDPHLHLSDIAWNGALFVAVSQNTVVTSADGRAWSKKYIGGNGGLLTVGWTGSVFVAAGGGSVYFISSNGVDWRPHPQAEGVTLRDMASNGDRLVAVGSRLEHGGVIYSTTDGVQWVESLLPVVPNSEFRDVTWTGTHFVAVARTADPSILTSTDGFSWTVESTGTGLWPVSVVGDERSLFVIGRGLQIIRRTRSLAGPEPPRRPDRRIAAVGGKTLASAPVQR